MMKPRNLVHRIDTCCERTLVSQIRLSVNRLDHHYGIIHHNGYSQKQRKREQVDGEPNISRKKNVPIRDTGTAIIKDKA